MSVPLYLENINQLFHSSKNPENYTNLDQLHSLLSQGKVLRQGKKIEVVCMQTGSSYLEAKTVLYLPHLVLYSCHLEQNFDNVNMPNNLPNWACTTGLV